MYQSKQHISINAATDFKGLNPPVKFRAGDITGWQRLEDAYDWQALLHDLTPANNLKENRVFKVGSLVIKRYPLRFLHADRCLNAFKAALALEKLQISHPQAVAYLKQGGYSYFVSLYLPCSDTINGFFASLGHDSARWRGITNRFALWMAEIHSKNIFQRDFKSCNVLYSNGDFWLVDLEGVRLRKPAAKEKIYNLAQLNASLGKHVSLKNRLRFLNTYAKNQNIPQSQKRDIIKQIWDITLTKNTAYYDLSPEDILPRLLHTT